MNNETVCKCGINEDTWVSFDLPCIGDGIHLWETQDLDSNEQR